MDLTPGLPIVGELRLSLPHLPALQPGEEQDAVVGCCDGPPATPEELEQWKRIAGPVPVPREGATAIRTSVPC